MRTERNVLCDKNEINIKQKTRNGYEFLNLNKDHIMQICFEKCTVKKLFRKVPTDKIEIAATGREMPIVFYRLEEGEHFDEYVTRLTEFARLNRIKLKNSISGETA